MVGLRSRIEFGERARCQDANEVELRGEGAGPTLRNVRVRDQEARVDRRHRLAVVEDCPTR